MQLDSTLPPAPFFVENGLAKWQTSWSVLKARAASRPGTEDGQVRLNCSLWKRREEESRKPLAHHGSCRLLMKRKLAQSTSLGGVGRRTERCCTALFHSHIKMIPSGNVNMVVGETQQARGITKQWTGSRGSSSHTHTHTRLDHSYILHWFSHITLYHQLFPPGLSTNKNREVPPNRNTVAISEVPQTNGTNVSILNVSEMENEAEIAEHEKPPQSQKVQWKWYAE